MREVIGSSGSTNVLGRKTGEAAPCPEPCKPPAQGKPHPGVSIPSLPAREELQWLQPGAGSGTGRSSGISRCCFTQALPAMLTLNPAFFWLSICSTLPCILILPSSGQDFYQAPAAACVKLPSLEAPVQLNLLKSVQKLHMLLEWEPFFTLLLP